MFTLIQIYRAVSPLAQVDEENSRLESESDYMADGTQTLEEEAAFLSSSNQGAAGGATEDMLTVISKSEKHPAKRAAVNNLNTTSNNLAN
jgi:hypothetical protein